MATTSLPFSSSHFFDLQPDRYEVDQLLKVVEATINDKNKESERSDEPTPPSSTHVHLHTCTIETSLHPPEPFLRYYGQAARPNEAYDIFTDIRQKVAAAVDPFTPLTLASPSSDVVRSGFVYIGHPFTGITVYSPGAHRRKYLARLYKPLPSAANAEWLPSARAWDMENWLHAILALDPSGEATRQAGYKDDKKRFSLLSGLQISWIPDGEGENAGVDLKLSITVHVFVDMETIFIPLPEVGNEMLGLILHSLIPSPTTVIFNNASEARAAALRHFYASLKPAPDLPFSYSANNLQPAEMVSRLLPFQTRTVYKLLQREKSKNVQLDPARATSDPPGFWKGYDFGLKEGRVAYRRITGDFMPTGNGPSTVDRKGKGRAMEQSPERARNELTTQEKENLPLLLDLSGVSGTMLCEEMGLGKTLEAIALVLLHRHPLSKPRFVMTSSGNGESSSHLNNISKQQAVPVIDLVKGTPGMDDPRIKPWIEGEQAAFADRRAYDEQAQLHVTEVATTLIVTPPSLLKQWVAEMQRHAPTLRVCVYEGWRSLQKGIDKQRAARLKAEGSKAEATRKRKAEQLRNQTRAKYARKFDGTRVKSEPEEVEVIEIDEEKEGTLQVTQRQFVEYVRAHDVVVTTYQDLSQDLKVALPAPPRSRRSNANYKPNERPRSPLVMVEWWRVIMDEVQLHGDTTDAANMVSLIPRKHALAVSGTPAKADIKDLMGSLKFLRVPVVPHDNRLWHRLQQPGMRQAFEGIFTSIAIRTTKKEVSGEFNLPHQTRYVVPIELSQIELHYYNDTLERFRDQMRLPQDPRDARPADWVLDRSLFLACLRNLRQICTHMQVGQLHAGIARGERRLNLGRAILSMAEALEKIRNDHSQEFLLESRQQMRSMIRKAQLAVLNEADGVRYLTALNLYEKVRTTAIKQLGPVREHLKTLLDGREDVIELDRDDTPDRAQSQQEREKQLALQAARQTIREISIILHQAWFFEGDVRHIQKQQAEEIHCYGEADAVRKEILHHPLERANLSVQMLEKAMSTKAAVQDVSDLQTDEVNHRSGLVSSDVVTQVNDLLEILNDNAYLVFEWRAKILALLSSPIDAETKDDAPAEQGTEVQDPEAEYYAEALKAQGEVEAYLIAFAAAVADRNEFLLENRSLLASHDARQKKQRSTKAAINAMADEEVPDVPDELQEQVKALMQERQAFRQARVDKECERPLKGYQIDLKAIANGPHRPEEIVLCRELANWLKHYIHKQSEYIESLNKELDMFRATFNRRVIYFAALQEISDSVSVPVYKDLEKELESCSDEITTLEVKLARMVVKGRYLQYLGNKQEGDEDIREDCIICFGSSDDNKAVLLQCGHYFCKSCFDEFRKSQMGRKCPACRTEINPKEVTQVRLSVTRQDLPGGSDQPNIEKAEDESQEEEMAEISPIEAEQERRMDELRKLKMVDDEKRREVLDMDLLGEYGSKINFLVKHLMYYRSKEPETRHVIFSNWSDSLNIVMQALEQNNIKYISFDQGRKQKDVLDQFLKDESISVFLLHAERESSGLTLTTCRVVHLLEPVLRHSFELQAIGRVDRLGQDKETTVYCYATMETVESRILSQGVRNGTSIYLADEDADGVVADMPNVASAAHKGGDVSLGGDANEEDLLGLIL